MAIDASLKVSDQSASLVSTSRHAGFFASRLPGHWGATPGQNFIYLHSNRVGRKYDVNMITSPPPDTAAWPSDRETAYMSCVQVHLPTMRVYASWQSVLQTHLKSRAAHAHRRR